MSNLNLDQNTVGNAFASLGLNLNPAQLQGILALLSSAPGSSQGTSANLPTPATTQGQATGGSQIPSPPQGASAAAGTNIPLPPASANVNNGLNIPSIPAGAGGGGGTVLAAAQTNVPGGIGAANSLLCPHCGHNVILPPTDSRWYAVYVGTRVGWVKGYGVAHNLTNGVSGNAWQHYNDEQSARSAFLARHAQNDVRVVGPTHGTNYPAVPPNNGWLYP
ncbi:hypothetical protein VNI00_015966 [Paramarasmius palmivorus]|uniref:Uncharacterized protein n=1 Tax=Paramarasmius palmivorus TaxID=297713 RepID=A0AAW0BHF3_9AGAR